MTIETMKKMADLQVTEEFEEELALTDSPEEMQRLFARYGAELTLDEIHDLVAYACKPNSEFYEDDLDYVVGGCLLGIGIRVVLRIISSRKRSSGGGGFR